MNSLNIMYSKDERAKRRGHLEERNLQSKVLIADERTLCLLLNKTSSGRDQFRSVCEMTARANNKLWLKE